MSLHIVCIHAGRRTELDKRHRVAVHAASASERATLKLQQQEEREELDSELEAETTQCDQEIILALDQLLTEQQSTLQVSSRQSTEFNL